MPLKLSDSWGEYYVSLEQATLTMIILFTTSVVMFVVSIIATYKFIIYPIYVNRHKANETQMERKIRLKYENIVKDISLASLTLGCVYSGFMFCILLLITRILILYFDIKIACYWTVWCGVFTFLTRFFQYTLFVVRLHKTFQGSHFAYNKNRLRLLVIIPITVEAILCAGFAVWYTSEDIRSDKSCIQLDNEGGGPALVLYIPFVVIDIIVNFILLLLFVKKLWQLIKVNHKNQNYVPTTSPTSTQLTNMQNVRSNSNDTNAGTSEESVYEESMTQTSMTVDPDKPRTRKRKTSINIEKTKNFIKENQKLINVINRFTILNITSFASTVAITFVYTIIPNLPPASMLAIDSIFSSISVLLC